MPKKAIVIGGGPAGLSAAIGLLRAGIETSVLERRSEWTDRVCGSFLNAEALSHLEWLGVDPSSRRSFAVASAVRLMSEEGATGGVSTHQSGRGAAALSRRDLEDLLSEAVIRGGGTIHPGISVRAVRRFGGSSEVGGRDVAGERLWMADYVVVAAGRFGLHQPSRGPGWYGWNATYAGLGRIAGDMGLHFYSGGYVGTLTFQDGLTNVCGLAFRNEGDEKSPAAIFEKAGRASSSLRTFLSGGARTTPFRGVGPLPFGRRSRTLEGTFLVGDAAAVGDPFMGEGIGRALGAGRMLFDCVRETGTAAEAVRLYEKRWSRAYTLRLWIGGGLRQLLQRSAPANLVAKHPWIAERLVPVFHRPEGRGAVPAALRFW